MRSVKFRDVLWAVARKAGFSPESGNFLTNQAIPVGEYINQWLDRLYAQEDWPEWTKLVVATPINHVVPYSQIATGTGLGNFELGRVIDVFLVDPATTTTPISVDFELHEDGVYVGLDHGPAVWVKYIEPAPDFTAETWKADSSYQRGSTVYVDNTGHCYKSKLNNNLGHDPSGSVTHGIDSIPIQTDTTQEVTNDVRAMPVQSQTFTVYLTKLVSGGVIVPDPPNASDVFKIYITDVSGNQIGEAFNTCDGIQILSDVVTQMVNQLLTSLGVGWTVTGDTTLFTVTISNPSLFNVGYAAYETFTPKLFESRLAVVQTSNYVAGEAAVPGVPQLIQVSLTQAQVIPGAAYQLAFNDIDGSQHVIEQIANQGDSVTDILQGLIDQVQAIPEPFFAQIGSSIDTVGGTATFSSPTPIGIDTAMQIQHSPWWEVVPFPKALVNAVVRGAGAELLGEWGQTDKEGMEQQKVPGEVQASRGDFETTPTPELTGQQKAYSRYRIQ